MNKTLHITNGQNLTDILEELKYEGEILTWHEMLCEGPTIASIDSEEFIIVRKDFLKKFYNIELDVNIFKKEIKKLNDDDGYTEIVLWFEYDLFCHINLIAVMSLIHQREIKLPLYLVCSGRVEGEKELQGLSEISKNQLNKHYKNKIKLNDDDRDLAISLWRTYCGKDHNMFKPYIVKNSSFRYMSNCLKAHLKRFPDSKCGMGVIERNILEIVKSKDIKSKHHLLGYILNYQGYYGYGDLQLKRQIEKLALFFDENKDSLTLNRLGYDALSGTDNYSRKINNDMTYGGINRMDYQFSITENKLINAPLNAN